MYMITITRQCQPQAAVIDTRGKRATNVACWRTWYNWSNFWQSTI